MQARRITEIVDLSRVGPRSDHDRLAELVTVDDVQRLARRRLPRVVYDFVAGGAGTESTVRANRTAWQQTTFRPRNLVDVTERDLGTTVLGEPVSLPVLLAPAGLARLVHPDGEVAAARAAADAGTVFALSTASSCTIEDVATAGRGPQWLQIYLWREREVVEGLVERARASGFTALCLTIDVPVVGQRERDVRNGMTVPPRMRPRELLDAATRVRWWRGFLAGRDITFENFLGIDGTGNDSAAQLGAYVNERLIDPSATWDDLTWLRRLWDGPLVVKGVLSGEEARRAVDLGADAVVVSNHGGRQLDGAVATASVLPEVVAAVGDAHEVYVDGGIRRGSDVVRALAMGARAAMVGRPWFWGLAAGGAAGVGRVLDILRADVDQTLALVGCPSVEDLDGSVIASMPGRGRPGPG